MNYSMDLSETAIENIDGREEWELNLTPEERRKVDDFAGQIDLTDTQMVLQYGVGRQKKLADFTDSVLANVKAKDLGEIGTLLTEVVTELKTFDEKEKKKGFFSRSRKKENKLAMLKEKYATAEENITRISKALERHQIVLLKDIAMLDKMYEMNVGYFKELSTYILAGKKRYDAAMNKELPGLMLKAERSGLPEDSQEAKDFSQMCGRFQKKIHDLELTRMVTLQMVPQIRLIQHNNSIMSDKIQSILVNTIPLWKNQMVIAIGLHHSAEAVRAQRAANDLTNGILRKNADILKAETIKIAKESERGIVDLETLQATNRTLIGTLSEVMEIQEDGEQKRRKAEEELKKLGAEMRIKLMEMNKIKEN